MDTPPTDETSTPVDTPARGRMPRMPSFKDPTAASAVMSHDYIFQRVSPLRNFARRVTANPAFETVVVLAIVANVIAMAMEDLPARHANVYSTANNAVNVVDKVTLAIYTAEFLLRVLAFGLMPLPRWCPAFLRPDQRIQISQDPSSKVVPIKNDYLGNMEAAMHAELRVGTDDLEAAQGQYYFKSNWNRLDFVVLCISYSAILVPGLNSLRSLRALRPLRMVQFVGPLHIILKSIWRAVGTLVDVVICLAFMFLFFALFGQQLFQGALLRRCVVPQGADAVRFNMSSPMFHDVMASVAQSPDAAPKNFTLYRPETFCSFASDAKGLACANVGRPTAVVSVLTHQGLEAVTVPTVCANYINPNFGFVSFDDLLHSLWTVFMMSSLNGWTDVMYALMDTDTPVQGVVFSIAIIVIIAFLGIQLFTSALCASSMHVRAEEALNRRRARAVQRAQRKLWLERNRLLKNVQVLASTWRKNTKRAKSETPARQRFNFSQFSKESLSTPQDSLSMPRTARSDITAPAFGSKQLPQLPVVATTVPNTPRHPDVLPLPQCSGSGLTTTKSCMIRPFSTHSIASEHAENASLSTRTVLQEQQATTALSPTLGNLPLSSDDAIVSAGSQPLAADNDLCMRMLTPPLVEAVASQASGTTISESNSQPGLRRSLVSTRLPTLSVRELKKPVSGLKQRALAPLRDRVVLSKLRKSRMSMMEPSTTPALDVAATMDEDTISTTSNVPVIPAFQRQRSLSESDMLKVQDRPGPVVATETDQQTVSTVASTVVAPAPISARRMQTLRTRSLKVKTNSTNSIQIKLSAATPGPTRKTIVLSRLTRMRTRIANSKLAAAVLAVIAVLAMLCRPVCRICRKVLDTTWFDKVIIGCIIVNAGCISSYYYGLSKNHETFLQISEFFFAWVFTLEMLVKVFGCGGLRAYLREKQNIFDFIVVMTSLPSIIIPLSAGTFQQKSSLAAVSSFRVFRLFRVFRVARLLHKVKSMRNLLSAVLGSFSSLMNLLFFIAFALVTLSIAATSLFSRSLPPTPDVAQAVDSHGYSMYATGQSPRYNFDSFFNSFVSLFIIMSGENWTDFFYYSMLIASPYVAILFQLFYFVFSNYVLLSLFIAIIVHNFDAKAEEREHQQRTAYSRVQELVRKRAENKLLRNRRISMATAVLMVTDSTRNIKKKFSAAVAPEPLPEVSTSEIINSDHGSVSLAAVSQASASEDMPCDQKMRSLISSCPSVDSNSVSDEHLLEEARLIGAAMDTTSLNAKDEPPVMEGRSLGCLSPTSRIRRACFNIATNRYFEWLVMLCIVASGVVLALQSGQTSTTSTINIPDVIFNSVFLFELFVKVVGLGFWGTGKSAYLKNSWNISDLCILIGSVAATLVDAFSSNGKLKFLRVFRLGRALRPLRVIRGNASMRVVVSSLMSSFTDVINVYFLSQFISIMFAIMGVSLFSGMFYSCNNPAASGQADCVGTFIHPTTGLNTTAIWSNPAYMGFIDDPKYSFDDVLNAYLVVKEVQVTEGWTEVLAASMDVTSIGEQPRFNASRMNAFFFIAIIAVGTFFVMQLYTGVIVQSYSRSEGTAFMTDNQRHWIQSKLQILQQKPPTIGLNHNVWWFRRLVQDFVIPCRASCAEDCTRRHHKIHSRIDTVVACAVGINMIVLMMYHYGMSDRFQFVLDTMNNLLLGVFGLEMLLKMFALGVKRYWKEPTNVFDGVIVIGSLCVSLLTLNSAFKQYSFISQIARLFRVGRMLRLLQNFPRLRHLFETIIAALPSMGNVTALLLLVLFVGTIVGVELFNDVTPREVGPGISRQANFGSFWSAFILLFRGLTGESINVLARDCMRKYPAAQVYFIMFNDLVKSVFLNLYLATIIDKLDGVASQKSRLFKEDFVRFEQAWLQHDQKALGYIPVSMLRPFLRKLKPPLGGPENPKEFTKWYLAIFPAIASYAKDNKIKYRDVLMALSTHAVDAGHLLVSERVHRDLIQSQSVKAMAALRIQCAFRSFKTRRLFENLRQLALSNVRRQSLTHLQSLLGLQLEKCNLEPDPVGTTSELAEL